MMKGRTFSKDDVFQGKLNVLSTHIYNNLPDLIDALGIKLNRYSNYFGGNCPIHEGDSNSFQLYVDSDPVMGCYYCRTKFCQDVCGKNIIGFVRGVLTAQAGAFDGTKEGLYPFKKTIDFICDTFNLNFDKISVDTEEVEKSQFISSARKSALTAKPKSGEITKETVSALLDIPSKYFLERGVSGKILCKYHVGDCHNPAKPFNNRAVVPIFDESGEKALGFTGRSIFEKCEKCEEYHGPGNCYSFCKWFNKGGFAEDQLYNYQFAKPFIFKSKVAILVEGQGDVWSLEGAAIHNSVGAFGCKLTDKQAQLLTRAGTFALVLALDNPLRDKAGKEATERIAKKFKDRFHIYLFPFPANKKDLGDMSVEDINQHFKPFIQKVESNYE